MQQGDKRAKGFMNTRLGLDRRLPLNQAKRLHIYLSSVLWDGFWIVQQPICNEIQREEPVLFVERNVSAFTVLRYPRMWRRLFMWLFGARRLSRHLRVLAPLPLFHLGHRFPRLFRIDFAVQRWWILFWAWKMTCKQRILWLDFPIFECAVSRMGEECAVYHVGDDPASFSTSHRPTMEILESRALRKASVVFAAADELARVRRAHNPNTYAIQNAIDVELFTADVDLGELADIASIPGPRVVFVGVIDIWVDVELLAHTAVSLPDINFVIVGTSRIDLGALTALPNVHVVGPRPRRLVPGVLRLCSASLVPFVKSALTAPIVPAKVWEALAAGIVPVCTAFSSNLAALEHAGLVLVARGREEYLEALRLAIAADTPDRRAEIAAFGLQQSWASRWREMNDRLQQHSRVAE